MNDRMLLECRNCPVCPGESRDKEVAFGAASDSPVVLLKPGPPGGGHRTMVACSVLEWL